MMSTTQNQPVLQGQMPVMSHVSQGFNTGMQNAQGGTLQTFGTGVKGAGVGALKVTRFGAISSFMNMVTYITTLATLFKSLFYLFIVAAIGYVVYLLVTVMYPRPFLLGHSEPFDEFMIEYMEDVFRILKAPAQPKSSYPGQLADVMSKVDAAIEGFKVGMFKANANTVPSTLKRFTKSDIPEVYIMFIFYEALQELNGNSDYNVSNPDNELALMTKMFPKPLVQKYFEKGSTTYIKSKDSSEFKNLFAMLKSFDELRNSLKDFRKAFNDLSKNLFAQVEVNNVVNNHSRGYERALQFANLDMLLNKYFDEDMENIIRGYNLRKSGGIGNMTIIRIYINDFKIYVFKEVIPKTWKDYLKDVELVALSMGDWLASDTVSNYIAKLPFKIAGMEGFTADSSTNNKNNKEQFSDHVNIDDEKRNVIDLLIERAMYALPGDRAEHFVGFIKAIANVFKGLGKVIMAMISVITDPMSFFKLILGLIIGLSISIVYTILLTIAYFVFWLPAAIFVSFFKILKTIYWVFLFVAYAIFYFILSILDMLTGGLILSMLRCENLPTAWFRNPGFARSNKYQRGFFCNYPCASRYYPDGWYCKRMSKYEPSHCPQAILYEFYREYVKHRSNTQNTNAQNTSPNAPTAIMRNSMLENDLNIYDFKADVAFLMKSKGEKKDILDEVYNIRAEYVERCKESIGTQKPLLKEICSYFIAQQEAKILAANGDTTKIDYSPLDEKQYESLKKLCRLTNCGGEKAPFYCNPISAAPPKKIQQRTRRDVITDFLKSILVFALLIVFVGTLYKVISKVPEEK